MAGFDRDYRYERLESLLDEPFAGVDPIAVEDIQHITANSALAINLTGR